METRVGALETAVQELRQFHAPAEHTRGSRRYLSLLNEYLSDDEAREVAFCCNLDWDSLPGGSKRGRLLSLVQEMERQGRLYQLEDEVRQRRPAVDWPPFV